MVKPWMAALLLALGACAEKQPTEKQCLDEILKASAAVDQLLKERTAARDRGVAPSADQLLASQKVIEAQNALKKKLEGSCSVVPGFADARLALTKKGLDLAKLEERWAQSVACEAGTASWEQCKGLVKDLFNEKQLPRAEQLLQRACDHNLYAACRRLAGELVTGDNLKQDLPRAKDLAERAVLGGDRWAHGILGSIYSGSFGDSSITDLKKAAASWQKGCDQGDGDSCGAFAQSVLIEGKVPGIARDPRRAIEMAKRGCDQKDDPSGMTCLVLAQIHRSGKAGRKDLAAALKYYATACTLDIPEGCQNEGAMYASGEVVVRDALKARGLFEKGCGLGLKESCASLEKMKSVSVKRDVQAAYDSIRVGMSLDELKSVLGELEETNRNSINSLYSYEATNGSLVLTLNSKDKLIQKSKLGPF